MKRRSGIMRSISFSDFPDRVFSFAKKVKNLLETGPYV